ncbi:hypothetical protein [Stappia sp. 28M-7]|uniref:hypothetical protein n=1 Tax=Stappia sp. 28M-7 TaxID=2762596 RepID=UPI000E741F45|nr:hypothetical protein [Stappia sp. 28M-7]MBC2860520.1 hypothetical protein [Stappia sp. 28M-7]
MTTNGTDARRPLRLERWIIAFLAVLFAFAAAVPYGARYPTPKLAQPVLTSDSGAATSAVLPKLDHDIRQRALPAPSPSGSDQDDAVVMAMPMPAEIVAAGGLPLIACCAALPGRTGAAHAPRAPPVSA